MTALTTSSLVRPCNGGVDRRLECTHGVDGCGEGHEVGGGAICGLETGRDVDADFGGVGAVACEVVHVAWRGC